MVCSLMKINRRFGGTYRLFFQGRRVSQASCLLHAGLLRDIFFDPEDGDNQFLRNVGSLPPDYMDLYRRRQPLLSEPQSQQRVALILDLMTRGAYIKIK
jgi:hypothetical protein